ncbi:pre-mRNA splicing factor component-domain-containing protein [Globomyces pollinis-pini]|nr:pre-mRNA splicing factor component-domain-containing protein [Globomyces pollinis-pini]
MKYGKNQWARISSLLTRKTPKQCKARWFEWLDPAIKKTEWSKEEDEKLLHLAKLMPTQWRTIAPIVGRTPAQCLERYQRLLDEAELGDDQGPNSDDVRKLRPGEIDPDPESKPARPDPVDMDEDEKEMLSEARARLANTQGKKAKRKAREKQLEEARRIATLQKKRELKAAGIDMKVKKKYRGMDYNADIPFYHPQPAGFFDVNEERLREVQEKKDLSNELLSKLDGKRRMETEEFERKRDFKKQKAKKESGEYVPPQALRDAQKAQITERRPLILPTPQISESDLEDIVKMGVSGETARSMVEAGSETPSNTLLGEYQSIQAPVPMRTPRIASENNGDMIHQMARNLKAISDAQTPLLGGDIILEGNLDFNGVTPQRQIASTPNPLSMLTPRGAAGATPRIDGTPGGLGMTPRMGLVGRTPFRDQMGINTPSGNFDETPRSQQPALLRQQLSSLFKKLPKPKNEFEIVLPERKELLEIEEQQIEKDGEDLVAEEQEEHKREQERKLKLRSQVVQQSLPRPVVSLQQLQSMYDDEEDTIESMINKEKALLLHRDATEFPLKNQKPLGAFYSMDTLDAYLDQAAQLIEEEFQKLDLDKAPKVDIPKLFEDYEYDPDNKCFTETPTEEVWKAQFATLKSIMKTQAIESQKLEKKLNVTMGGYLARSKLLLGKFKQTHIDLEQAELELSNFKNLALQERNFIQSRIHSENKEVERLAMMEQDLQDHYRYLSYVVKERQPDIILH